MNRTRVESQGRTPHFHKCAYGERRSWCAAPMPADKALTEAYTKLFRNDVTDLRITGVKQIPGLVAKLNQPGLSGQGVGLRAEYTLNGVPVEEEASDILTSRETG